MNQELLSFFQGALTTSPLLGIVFILWRSGVLDAMTKRLLGIGNTNNNEERMQGLEQFMKKAETNHFHDLENMKEDMKEVKTNIDRLQNHTIEIRERIIRIEVKVHGNGYGEKH